MGDQARVRSALRISAPARLRRQYGESHVHDSAGSVMEIGLDDAYALATPQDSKRLYADWAATYESDFVASQGYGHPRVIADHFHSVVPVVETVIDIGAGTGLVGQELARIRPELIIDGIDISPEMLEQARTKGVYRNLYERDLTGSVTGTAAPYDALICIGVFTHGHLGPEALVNLLPLVRAGGYCVIGVNERYFQERGFDEAWKRLGVSHLQRHAAYVYDEASPHRESRNLLAVFQCDEN